MKIAIMCAMEEELKPLLNYFKKYEVENYANNKYYKVTYENKELVLAYSKIGKVFSSLTASTLIQKFGCGTLLFSGVAGAINPNLRIGDIIIASKLSQHDLDITAFGHPHGFVPEGNVFTHTTAKLNDLAKSVAHKHNINLKIGSIATGDQFIADKDKKEWIEKTFEADALEMEGASVSVVCDALKVPYLILRSISDTADGDASFDFDEFLEKSSKISADFLTKIVDNL